MSRAYMKGLLCEKGRNPSVLSRDEEMRFYRSRPFELLEREGRREFLRLLLGVCRYLVQSKESTMVTEEPKRGY